MRLVGPALLVLAALAGSPVAGQPVIELAPGEALISIEAQGVYRTRPDVMTITAGAVTAGATVGEAVQANNVVAQRLVEVVREHGVEARDVRTTDFGVEPRFEGGRDPEEGRFEGEAPRIIGYVVENRLEIRLRRLEGAQRLISRLFEAGANSVSGPNFGLSDERPAARAAERDAIAQARAAAENYAAAVGRRLGRILRISDRRAYTEQEDDVVYVTGSSGVPTPIEPGEVATRATVFVDFALAPQ